MLLHKRVILSYKVYTTEIFSKERLRDITIQKNYIILIKPILLRALALKKGLRDIKTKSEIQRSRSQMIKD